MDSYRFLTIPTNKETSYYNRKAPLNLADICSITRNGIPDKKVDYQDIFLVKSVDINTLIDNKLVIEIDRFCRHKLYKANSIIHHNQDNTIYEVIATTSKDYLIPLMKKEVAELFVMHNYMLVITGISCIDNEVDIQYNFSGMSSKKEMRDYLKSMLGNLFNEDVEISSKKLEELMKKRNRYFNIWYYWGTINNFLTDYYKLPEKYINHTLPNNLITVGFWWYYMKNKTKARLCRKYTTSLKPISRNICTFDELATVYDIYENSKSRKTISKKFK